MAEKEVEAWAAAQLREKVVNAGPGEAVAIRDAGLLPLDVIEYLAEMERRWPEARELLLEHDDVAAEDIPYYAHETQHYQDIVRRHASLELRRALRNGDTTTIHHFLGVVSQDTDVSGIQFYEAFRTWIVREAQVTYLAGHMGSGKTDLALLIGEVWDQAYQDGTVASNIESCPETETITSQDGLEEWLDETPGKKLFIFDEASSHASGYNKDRAQVEAQLLTMVNKIRKEDGNLVIIGHSGKDVHPHVRRLADYAEKDGVKDATVFEEVVEGEGEDKKFDLSRIPPTSWTFDTKEDSAWKWKDEADDEQAVLSAACTLYVRSDMTQEDVADIFPSSVTATKISRNYQDLAVTD